MSSRNGGIANWSIRKLGTPIGAGPKSAIVRRGVGLRGDAVGGARRGLARLAVPIARGAAVPGAVAPVAAGSAGTARTGSAAAARKAAASAAAAAAASAATAVAATAAATVRRWGRGRRGVRTRRRRRRRSSRGRPGRPGRRRRRPFVRAGRAGSGGGPSSWTPPPPPPGGSWTWPFTTAAVTAVPRTASATVSRSFRLIGLGSAQPGRLHARVPRMRVRQTAPPPPRP